ncbi:putative Rab GDP dissociation inhibitor beta [Monocercomonoides exilis]|uniref:putative Rab GDP dissociation inhibitor beta n=1 Tax=Monocercomonoides exilis TaxID=2049356 RepID=UPI00355A84BD|nr:putative Rab GDP dissociation inhibitor beta [Monocercomonoides exilis]|eukprot:MONOS_13593.1-p1 / transcript=MONOS_13593.1 / gene=MONOS_13593 / organism=Monocercomonoides_exilis_PA203 / gene_product=Rab GDP dissociation inhibitor beta / transcript_product=Rab GDP dissociation inhibitor beta / location=Mono_scaffold00851:5457-7216(-) / protein_length=489 / sequence_SO=supercontig / SO=protein_coding / is_pseudo=false
MDEEYEVIILGTGLTECILAAILSCHGKKVLHIDRNEYYGGDCGSLSLDQTFAKFRGPDVKPPAALGRSRDYNIDLVPKFPLSKGNIMKAIVHTGCNRYLEFHRCKGAFLVKKDKPYKVPSTTGEAATTGLVGMFQKPKLVKFLEFVSKCDADSKDTWQGMELDKIPMKDVFKKFDLNKDTCEFVGHGMGLHLNEQYLDEPALPTVMKIRLYGLSVATYGESPYLYPKYGIGEVGQGFARLSAVFGAVYILNCNVDKILFDENGNVRGISAGTETPRAPRLVMDPSYFPEYSRSVGKIARAICIMSHPVKDTDNADSGMIIIPQSQCGRHHDVYVSFLSSAHCVCPKGKFLAFVSTTVETAEPEKELAAGMKLLNPVDEYFFRVSELYAPIKSGDKNIHVSNSIDATSHFETVMDDVFRLYKEVTGEDLDLTKEAEEQEKTRQAAGCIPMESSSTAEASSSATPSSATPEAEASSAAPASESGEEKKD